MPAYHKKIGIRKRRARPSLIVICLFRWDGCDFFISRIKSIVIIDYVHFRSLEESLSIITVHCDLAIVTLGDKSFWLSTKGFWLRLLENRQPKSSRVPTRSRNSQVATKRLSWRNLYWAHCPRSLHKPFHELPLRLPQQRGLSSSSSHNIIQVHNNVMWD